MKFENSKNSKNGRNVTSGKSSRRSKAAVVSARTCRSIEKSGTNADTATRILDAVRRIPKGRVSTYGSIAQVAGLPRRARLVGTVLRQTPGTRGVPWHRVINAGGRISFSEGSDAHLQQKRKLQAEGIEFRHGRINLDHFGWPPNDRNLDALLWKIT